MPIASQIVVASQTRYDSAWREPFIQLAFPYLPDASRLPARGRVSARWREGAAFFGPACPTAEISQRLRFG
jgi:hypothetical protein